ncbi:MAG: hypothetical protein ABR991_09815, partial [Terracidiphilus sp.]
MSLRRVERIAKRKIRALHGLISIQPCGGFPVRTPILFILATTVVISVSITAFRGAAQNNQTLP